MWVHFFNNFKIIIMKILWKKGISGYWKKGQTAVQCSPVPWWWWLGIREINFSDTIFYSCKSDWYRRTDNRFTFITKFDTRHVFGYGKDHFFNGNEKTKIENNIANETWTTNMPSK